MADVLILGASVNGLVAATYLAKSGAKVTVLEAAAEPGGVCAPQIVVGGHRVPAASPVLTALDPRVVTEQQLAKRGLGFAVRDLPLVALGDGASLVFSRDVHETRRSLAEVSGKDAACYAGARRTDLAVARALRRIWWEDGVPVDASTRMRLRSLQVTASAAFVESAFESDVVRAAFVFDALAVHPQSPGGAQLFAWAAAQEMCGLQAAAALPAGGLGALVDVLADAAEAAGAKLRCNAVVARLEADGEAVRGVVLGSGETVEGRTILSSLTRRRTLLELLPPGVAGFAAARKIEAVPSAGEARLILALSSCPAAFARPARYRIGERLEAAVLAHVEARAGRIPADLFLEAVPHEPAYPAPENPDEILLSVSVRPVPLAPDEGWKAASAKLIPAVVRELEHHAPGLTATILAMGFVPPAPRDGLCLADLALPWSHRIATPVRGLFLCGQAAEPVPCVSGRGGRLAAALASKHLAEVSS